MLHLFFILKDGKKKWTVRHVSFTVRIGWRLQGFHPTARGSVFPNRNRPLTFAWARIPWHTELALGPSACQRSAVFRGAWSSSLTGKFYSSGKNSPPPSLHLCVEPSLIPEKWIQPSLQQPLLRVYLPRGSRSQLCLPVVLKMSHQWTHRTACLPED